MTMEFTTRRGASPLPGGPKPYFLAQGGGEKAILIDSLFTVLLSADETGGQFGVFTMDGPKGDAITSGEARPIPRASSPRRWRSPAASPQRRRRDPAGAGRPRAGRPRAGRHGARRALTRDDGGQARGR